MSDSQPQFNQDELKQQLANDLGNQTTKPLVTGPVLMVLTLVLVLVLGGIFYLWTVSQTTPINTPPPLRPTAATNQEPETPTATAQVESLGALSTSDEIVTIEADLEATQLDNLEAELLQIEAELNGGI